MPPRTRARSATRCPRGRCSPRCPGALAELRGRGWRLVMLSNTDADFLAASLAAIGVPFDGSIVAGEIGSYKPAHGHWNAFAERPPGARPARPRGREPLPRHRAGRRARPPRGVDQPAGGDERPAASGRAHRPVRPSGHAGPDPSRVAWRAMSRLRAKCPDCRTLTAVALDEGQYECHSCGRTFRPASSASRAPGGPEARRWPKPRSSTLPYPETAVVDEDSLAEQSLALAAELPDRPIVLGGCCCAHVGAVEGLADAPRPPRRRLARRPRRPEHARDARRAGTSGGCPSGCCSTPAPCTPPTRCSWGRGTSTRRRRSSSPRAGSAPASTGSTGRSTGGRRLRRLRRRRARPGR